MQLLVVKLVDLGANVSQLGLLGLVLGLGAESIEFIFGRG